MSGRVFCFKTLVLLIIDISGIFLYNFIILGITMVLYAHSITNNGSDIMKNLNCINCGAPMRIDVSAVTAVCRYCGTVHTLNHEDTDYFSTFFRRMGGLFSGDENEQQRKKRAEELWKNADEQNFECTDGNNISIRYMYRFRIDDTEVFVARRNIIFHFLKNWTSEANNFRKYTSLLDYPSADTRNLASFFPTVSGGFELTDRTGILVITKNEDEYPLCLFGRLSGRHTAWIISRLENLCCVLEYNGLVHPGISIDTVYINPYTHQASLYGGFSHVVKNNSLSPDKKTVLTTKHNLLGLRDTAANLLGFERAGLVRSGRDIPPALADFINSVPKHDAYEDFEAWDKALIKAYGERRFITMDTDDEQIYGNPR